MIPSLTPAIGNTLLHMIDYMENPKDFRLKMLATIRGQIFPIKGSWPASSLDSEMDDAPPRGPGLGGKTGRGLRGGDDAGGGDLGHGTLGDQGPRPLKSLFGKVAYCGAGTLPCKKSDHTVARDSGQHGGSPHLRSLMSLAETLHLFDTARRSSAFANRSLLPLTASANFSRTSTPSLLDGNLSSTDTKRSAAVSGFLCLQPRHSLPGRQPSGSAPSFIGGLCRLFHFGSKGCDHRAAPRPPT